MKKETKDHILRSVQKARDEFDAAMEEIGTKIRLEVVIPACKQHKLEFISGMGRFFFTTQNGENYGADYEVEGTRLERTLLPIFELLNKEYERHQVLGYLVSDVRKKDY